MLLEWMLGKFRMLLQLEARNSDTNRMYWVLGCLLN